MHTRCSGIQKSPDLVGCKDQTGLTHSFSPTLAISFFHLQIEFAWDTGSTQREDAFKRSKTLHGEDTGKHGLFNAKSPQFLHQVKIFAHIKKKLGDGKISPGSNLFRCIAAVTGKTVRLGVRGGISGNANAHIGLCCPDKAHKIAGMLEIAAHGLPLAILRRISP